MVINVTVENRVLIVNYVQCSVVKFAVSHFKVLN